MTGRNGLFIDGDWRAPAVERWLDVDSPSTEERIGRVALGAVADMEASIVAARRAFASGPWPQLPLDRLITRRYDLDQVETALTDMDGGSGRGVIIFEGAQA